MNALETLRDLLPKMTPGPWRAHGCAIEVDGPQGTLSVAGMGAGRIYGGATTDNAEGIAILRNIAPELLRVIEAARACYEEDDFITVPEEGDGRHERDRELGAALDALVRA